MNQKILFDRGLLRQNAARAIKHFNNHNFLYIEVANKIAESLQFLNHDFDDVLEIGARDGYLLQQIALNKNVKKIITTDICGEWTPAQGRGDSLGGLGDNLGGLDDSLGGRGDSVGGHISEYHDCHPGFTPGSTSGLVADDEYLPFKKESFDLVVSNLNLHFINQVPQFLLQVKNILKPNGIFIASFFGEENLSELAHSLFAAENEIYGGVSPRMSPTIDVKTAAHLLQKAGFVNPISDFEKIEVSYSSPLNLLKDLKMMGQGNILVERSKKFVSKRFLNCLDKNYRNLYGLENGGVRATFEIVTVTGWKN